MISVGQLIVENQLVIMRELGYRCTTQFMRDQLREQVRRSTNMLHGIQRDEGLKREESRRSRKPVRGRKKITS